MGLFDKIIKQGMDSVIGKTMDQVAQKAGQAAQKQVADKVDAWAGNLADKVSPKPEQADRQNAAAQTGASLGAAFNVFQGMAESFATEAGKSMKICPSCGEGASSSNTVCPNCGADLPEQTVSQGAVCQKCGLQNAMWAETCTGCGEKLPNALAREQAQLAKDQAALAQWSRLLPQYPLWTLGGSNINLDESSDDAGRPVYMLNIDGVSQTALEQYRDLLLQSGFKMAGQYPSRDALYKKTGEICHCFNSQEPFPSDEGRLCVYFLISEPSGGYDYVKPEPKPKTSLFDLFK